jgi:transketolase
MLRAIPNMTVCAPADPVEAKAAACFMARHRGPGYVRINKSGELPVHEPASAIEFIPGQLHAVRPGTGVAVLATGAIVGRAVEEINASGKDWAVYSVPFVGAYDRVSLLALAARYQLLVTMEEHQLNAGFGSSIIEALSDLYAGGDLDHMPKVKRIGIPNVFISTAGSQDYLRSAAGVSLAGLLG